VRDPLRKDDLSWSAKNKVDIVRRKTCPDMSCPLLNRGVACQFASGNESGVRKRSGCVDGESRDLVRQYSCGTEITPPFGKASMHSPPERAITRSRTAGPKNQLVNTSQMPVSVSHWKIRSLVCTCDGLVKYRKKNAADVQPHAFLMKMMLRKLDLLAK